MTVRHFELLVRTLLAVIILVASLVGLAVTRNHHLECLFGLLVTGYLLEPWCRL